MSSELIRTESKKGDRTPIAKVRITWTDPLIDLSMIATANTVNRIDATNQVADLITDVPHKWLYLNGQPLDGSRRLAPYTTTDLLRYQVGWWSGVLSDINGLWTVNPTLDVSFSPRPVYGFTLAGDSAYNEYPVEFYVRVYKDSTLLEEKHYTANTQVLLSDTFSNAYIDADAMQLEIVEWSEAGATSKIAEFYSSIVREYEGSDILRLSILQETEGAAGALPLGQMSCNEMDLTLQNLEHEYFPFNKDTELYTLVKRNRKIEPFVGFKIGGVDYYVSKGVYWSGDWHVGEQETGASVSARDRMELLRNVKYTGFIDDEETPAEATYWENKSLKYVVEEILNSLKTYMPDLFWMIDDELDSIIIPLAFFKRKSYFEVLRDIVRAGTAFAYFDTPTSEEAENEPLMKDILRIKHIENMFPETESVNLETAYNITQDDYIDRKQPANTEEVINTVNIVQKMFSIDEESGLPKETDRYGFLYSDEASVREYGEMKHDYPDCDLLQNESLVLDIAEKIVCNYERASKNVEVRAFGDPTLQIADRVIFPQYQEDPSSGMLGLFALKRITTEFDGTLRVSYGGFKLLDVEVI